MAKKDATETAQPEITVQLFELSPEEKKFIKNREQARAEEADNQPNAAAEAQARQKALFDALIAKYPPSIGHGGLRVWRHADLGEAAYIEVAINGGFFDPRGAKRDYRPDLDVPSIGGQSSAPVFLKG